MAAATTYQFVDDDYNLTAHHLLHHPRQPHRLVENVDQPWTTMDIRQETALRLYQKLCQDGVVAQEFEERVFALDEAMIRRAKRWAIKDAYRKENRRVAGDGADAYRWEQARLVQMSQIAEVEADTRVFYQEPEQTPGQTFIEDLPTTRDDEQIETAIQGERLAARYRTGTPLVRKAIRLMMRAFAYVEQDQPVPVALRMQITRLRQKAVKEGTELPMEITALRA